MDSEKVIKRDNEYVLHTYARNPITIEKGHGLYAEGPEGQKYLDFTSGIGVNSLGYCDMTWAEAVTLAARISAPLVLHGSSYTPDDQLAEAVRHGISKINVATEVSDTMIRATLEHTRSLEKVKYANQLTDAPYQAVTELVRHKIRLFGGSGKA